MENRGRRGGLKHMPFFEAVGTEEEDSPRSRIAQAGLLVLRHIDFWVMAGMVMVDPECMNVRSSRNAIAALEPDNPQREPLFTVINAMQTSREVDVVPLLPHLERYAQLLDGEEWSKPLAADVRVTIERVAREQCEDNEEAELLARLLALMELPEPPEEDPPEAR
jgi:hypothetical protein